MHLLRLFPILCAVLISVVSVEITDSPKESEFLNTTEISGVIVCNCGKNSYCGIDINKRTHCICDAGYKYLQGECERCDCGAGESNCDFKGGVRTCSCKDGYATTETGGACIEKCNGTQACQNGGSCVESACRCLNGTSGDFCQTVDYCRDKCGKVAECVYNVTSQEASCKCKDSTLIFDEYWQRCSVCDCGVHAKECTFVRGQKSCSCWDGYADRSGKCTLCFCTGKSSATGCRFDGQGTKVCNCSKGYEQHGEECEECDCGPNGKCRFTRWGDKKCNCDEGYSLLSTETCKECNCGKNGMCFFTVEDDKRCSCHHGYELFQGNCERCECGKNATCKWSNLYGKVCTCLPGFALKSDECTPCECGEGINCTFGRYDGAKMCDCPKGYGDDRGACKVCECGIPEASCTFSEEGRECSCPKGYELDFPPSQRPGMGRFSRVCKDIDECQSIRSCPSTTICVNTPGSYDCICKDGYEIPTRSRSYNVKKDGCQDIDECEWRKDRCHDRYARCVNIPGSYACDCLPGYTLVRRPGSPSNHQCIEGFYGWRISAIVLSCFSGVLVIGISCAACRRCRRKTKTSV